MKKIKSYPYPTIKVNAAIMVNLFAELRKTGHFFTAVFIKKTNGELREMTCRFGVKKHVTGKGLKFDPVKLGYFPVWDSVKKDYRMLNLNTLLFINYAGKSYQF